MEKRTRSVSSSTGPFQGGLRQEARASSLPLTSSAHHTPYHRVPTTLSCQGENSQTR